MRLPRLPQPRPARGSLPDSSRRGRVSRWAALGLALVVMVPMCGCSGKRRHYKHPVFVTEGDAVKYLKRALESPLPDERREAVQQVARTRYLTHETVLDALDTIARTDSSTAVRCAALAALASANDPRAAPTIVAVLAEPPADPDRRQAQPTDDKIRMEAMRAAWVLIQNPTTGQDHRDAFRDAAIRHTTLGSRDVRQAAARVLGYCACNDALPPLIDALEQRDFGVAYEAERSLMRLTGKTFDHDAIRWREWLADTEEPLADAGALDHVLEPPSRNWWQRSIDSTRRTLASFRPKKDKS